MSESAKFLCSTLKAELLCQVKEKRTKSTKALGKPLGLTKGGARQMAKSCPKCASAGRCVTVYTSVDFLGPQLTSLQRTRLSLWGHFSSSEGCSIYSKEYGKPKHYIQPWIYFQLFCL